MHLRIPHGMLANQLEEMQKTIRLQSTKEHRKAENTKRHDKCERRGVSLSEHSEGFMRLRFGGLFRAGVIYGMY